MTVHGSSDSVAHWTTSKAFHDAGRSHLLDRDHSLVAFNERVFSWAARTDVPVLERLELTPLGGGNEVRTRRLCVATHTHTCAKAASPASGTWHNIT